MKLTISIIASIFMLVGSVIIYKEFKDSDKKVPCINYTIIYGVVIALVGFLQYKYNKNNDIYEENIYLESIISILLFTFCSYFSFCITDLFKIEKKIKYIIVSNIIFQIFFELLFYISSDGVIFLVIALISPLGFVIGFFLLIIGILFFIFSAGKGGKE